MATQKNNVHIMLQGKGGVGKTLCISLYAQFLLSKNPALLCFDTDPINQTFTKFSGLAVEHINLFTNDAIDSGHFDSMIQKVVEAKCDCVIDNGASSFLPLLNYLKENQIIDFLKTHNKQVIIHTVITGGQSIKETLSGLLTLAESLDAKIVVWLNTFFGKVEINGKLFTDMKVYTDNQARIIGIMNLIQRTKETFGVDMQKMLTASMTFDEAIKSETTFILTKNRLQIMQRDINSQLKNIAYD